MLVLSLPSPDPELPPQPRRPQRAQRRRGGVVWQPHYAGFATIAYRDGRAIAGVSGPWSNQYVLIWWQPDQPVRGVEVFDSLDAAKAEVARAGAPARLVDLIDELCHEPIVLPRPAWFERLARWPARLFGRAQRPARAQRRRTIEDTDLRGLNFRAVR
jgi:hypothetical protein